MVAMKLFIDQRLTNSNFTRKAAGGSPQSLKPGRWLDLYSGTGSVGIEAISRGCSQVRYYLSLISRFLRDFLE